MPDIGLDPSWRLAINEAVGRRYSFGSRIVFTYGPYASVFTGAWHPAVATLTLGACAWLALAYTVAIRAITPADKVAAPLLICLAIAFLSTSRDALLLSYPFLTVVATCHYATAIPTDCRSDRWRWVGAAIVYSAAGLLVLVKVSLIVACGLSVILNASFLAYARRGGLAILTATVPVASMLFFWNLSGQSSDALLPYFFASLWIAQGYSNAMGLFGDSRTVFEYLVGIGVLIGALTMLKAERGSTRVFLMLGLLLIGFLVFKGSFVRQDGEHALIASSFLLLAAAILTTAFRSVAVVIAAAFAFGSWVVAELRHDPLYPTNVAMRVTDPFESAIKATLHRWADPRWPRSLYDKSLARIAAARPLPPLDGTTDIYSHAQSLLIASGNTWSPRPVFQSYSAYNERLAARNADFLAGPDAPRNILFAIEPIDRRLPALEDGASWPALLEGYRAMGFAGGLLRLQRRGTAVVTPSSVTRTSAHRIGEVVTLPDASGPVRLALDVRPTPYGRFMSTFFKTSALLIAVELDDGSSHTFLLPPDMARDPFLLSPLVENTRDFMALFEPEGLSAGKRVRSFRLLTTRDGDDAWIVDYRASFKMRDPTR